MNFARLTLLLVAALFTATAVAQQYPVRAIRLVVGFPPGGGTDIIARHLAQKLTESWGQQVVVDNRPGATGMIGANSVAKSTPDGYTLLFGHANSQAIAPSLVQKPLYDTLRDFTNVAYIGYVPNVLVVNPSTPAHSVKELVALAKARPGELSFASSGVGSANHLAGEMFKKATGINIVHVPYKGSGPAQADLLAGHVVMNFDALPGIINHIKQSRMRPLAVTTKERDPQLPNVPTLREEGLELDVTSWYGVVGPAGLPKEIVVRLNAEINRIMQLPDIKIRMDEIGTRLNQMSPEKFTEFLHTEVAKYQKVAKETGVRME